MAAAGCVLRELAAAEGTTLAVSEASSCVARISMGPDSGSVKKLRPMRSSMRGKGLYFCQQKVKAKLTKVKAGMYAHVSVQDAR